MHRSVTRVSVGIIKQNNTVLICQRPPNKTYSGYWEFPGGKIEETELSEAAIKRELKEELNIDVHQVEEWFEHLHCYPEKTVLLELWKIIKYSGKPIGNEGQILHWATFTELTQLQLLEGNLAIIGRLREYLEVC